MAEAGMAAAGTAAEAGMAEVGMAAGAAIIDPMDTASTTALNMPLILITDTAIPGSRSEPCSPRSSIRRPSIIIRSRQRRRRRRRCNNARTDR